MEGKRDESMVASVKDLEWTRKLSEKAEGQLKMPLTAWMLVSFILQRVLKGDQHWARLCLGVWVVNLRCFQSKHS